MNVIERPTKKYSNLIDDFPEFLVLHHFETYTDENERYNSIEDVLQFLADSEYKASANMVIDTDGTKYELVRPEFASWHAGKSHFHGKHSNHSINRMSYGIEIIRAEEYDFEYTPQQYYSVSQVADSLITQGLDPKNITTHEYIRREYNVFAEANGLEQGGFRNDPYKFDFAMFYSFLFNFKQHEPPKLHKI